MKWITAGLGLTQVIGYGTLYYAFALLVPSVAATFHTPEAVLYGIFSGGLLAGGMAAPRLGAMMDRYGAPLIMVWGSVAAGLAMALVAMSPTLWAWAVCIVLLEVISVAVLYDAAFASLVRFAGGGARKHITRLTLIAGFASTIFWPLTGTLVDAVGWRGTVGVYAGLHLFVATSVHFWMARLPLTDAVGDTPVGPQQVMFAPLPVARQNAAFWALAISFAMSGALISAFGVHMVGILRGVGLGAQATLVAMLMGPAQVSIRLVDAVFWRAVHPVQVAMVSALALPIAISGLFLGLPLWFAAPLLAVLFGVGQGLASIVRGSVPLALFGPSGYGGRLGRLALVRTVLGAAAPFAFALLQGLIGLHATLLLFVVIGVLAALPLFGLRRQIRGTAIQSPA